MASACDLPVNLAVPVQTKDGAWITIVKSASGWGFAWRTNIMPASSFWYFPTYREMLKARNRFISDHFGRMTQEAL